MSDSSQSTSGSQTDSSFEELKPLKKKKKGSKKRRPANVWSEVCLLFFFLFNYHIIKYIIINPINRKNQED